MYPSIELQEKKAILKKKKEEALQFMYVRKKLRTYVAENANAKDLRLLECHAHCFISLS